MAQAATHIISRAYGGQRAAVCPLLIDGVIACASNGPPQRARW